MSSDIESGIYKITNIIDSKIYVGSAINLKRRWVEHVKSLQRKAHKNIFLQRAWEKHGENSFQFTVLELVDDKNNLLIREQFWIDKLCVNDTYYNICLAAGSQMGMKRTPESRKLMSEAAIKRRIRDPITATELEKMHEGRRQKGYVVTEETKEKIREARAKQVFSAETKALWSKNRTGRKMPEWFGEFTRQHKTGSKHTPEAKAKISASAIARNSASVARSFKIMKLSQEDIIEIKTLWATGLFTQVKIAAKYGVDASHISRIVNLVKRKIIK